ncbi:hypothetical protein [Enterobacter hormaechei]|uniref:hypothetical protein n=1 Tax=Enterobacter hormaechei TaxID=158836 RepID=UPI0026F2BAE7|nr:hypothetical protein [Enterobacter hormaechei]
MANGTINLVNNSTALTGAGSKFLTEVTPGDFIYVEVGTVPYTLPVDKVSSDTSITLLRKFTGPTINGIAWTLIPRRAQNSVASALADQVAEAIQLSLNNENNWQKLLTENGNVTITRPDGSSYTGPSWVYLLSKLGDTATAGFGSIEVGEKKPSSASYIDFHYLGTNDYDARILCGGNSHGGMGKGDFTFYAGKYTFIGDSFEFRNPLTCQNSITASGSINAGGSLRAVTSSNV